MAKKRVVVETKHFYETKTFWVNLLFFIVAVLEAWNQIDFIPEQYENQAIAAIAAINIGLRYLTAGPIGVKAQHMVNAQTGVEE